MSDRSECKVRWNYLQDNHVSYFCRRTGRGGVYLQMLVQTHSNSTSAPETACT